MVGGKRVRKLNTKGWLKCPECGAHAHVEKEKDTKKHFCRKCGYENVLLLWQGCDNCGKNFKKQNGFIKYWHRGQGNSEERYCSEKCVREHSITRREKW